MPQTDMNRKFSVIIPVFGEADGINALLAHVQAIAPHGTQIVVADGHPERTTLAAINNFPPRSSVAPRPRDGPCR